MFQHELLNLPLRRLLHDEAVPTQFAHNIEKQPQKRKSSVRREEEQIKRRDATPKLSLCRKKAAGGLRLTYFWHHFLINFKNENIACAGSDSLEFSPAGTSGTCRKSGISEEQIG